MKVFNPLLLITLLFSLALTGCDDGGFSISSDSTYVEHQEEDKAKDSPTESTGESPLGGGNGSSSEDHKDEKQPIDEELPSGTPGNPIDPVNIGNQIVTFKLQFIKLSDDDFVLATFNEDPFDEKYYFSYYTIDNKELENSKLVLKETVDEKETYKFYVGSDESMTYTIQFYNQDGKQYGRSEIIVNNPVIHYSFFNNVFNIIEVKIITIGMNIINQYNKIKEFFRRMFGGNGLTI